MTKTNRLLDMNLVAYFKGRDRYLVLFDDALESRVQAIQTCTDWGFDRELNLGVTGAQLMHNAICQQVEKAQS